MKYCSKCHQSFPDDSSDFCRNDGAVLYVSPTRDIPFVTSPMSSRSEAKLQTPVASEEPRKVIARHIVSPAPLLIGIALICSIAIGTILLVQHSGAEKEPLKQDVQKNASVPPVSRSEIDRLIQDWKQAWESRNIEAYSQYYADSFIGNNYSANRDSSMMNRSEWLNDKRQKFQRSGEILVDIGAVTINYDGNDAVVSFLQDYHSDGYIDHGNKTLRLRKQSNGTIKIVQEDFRPALKNR